MSIMISLFFVSPLVIGRPIGITGSYSPAISFQYGTHPKPILKGLSLVRSQQPTLYDFPAPSQALQHRCPPPTRVPGQIIRGLVSTFFTSTSSPSVSGVIIWEPRI
ncbi:hypothetical protein CBS63078_8412 [Aspergillus niger]|nr:hypothetical protein CBS133816_11002 [Aspergillus niger]KAI2822602.1 hypothetical protein CBS115989_1993 [Aspergillus niger]KAI2849249.1 hypothetical protein CBS11350_2401 [Aspergillus niger]KAI2851542.1 hypothetical protein CBS12448_8477 [Aspergillus niger]KAI2859885.1 hypothetical protein CBS11232_1814 [Aspergillus niger]